MQRRWHYSQITVPEHTYLLIRSICLLRLAEKSQRCREESLFTYLQTGERRTNWKMWLNKAFVDLAHVGVPAKISEKIFFFFLRLEYW